MSIEDARLQVYVAFGQAVAVEMTFLDRKALAAARTWFDDTVGAALKAEPKSWTAAAQRYVLKHVRKIGRRAGNNAFMAGSPVTAAILVEAVISVIREQKAVCARVDKSGVGDRLKLLGKWCSRVKV